MIKKDRLALLATARLHQYLPRLRVQHLKPELGQNPQSVVVDGQDTLRRQGFGWLIYVLRNTPRHLRNRMLADTLMFGARAPGTAAFWINCGFGHRIGSYKKGDQSPFRLPARGREKPDKFRPNPPPF